MADANVRIDFTLWDNEAEYAHFIPWSGVPILGFRECLTCHALTMATKESTSGHIQWHVDKGDFVVTRTDATMHTEPAVSQAKGDRQSG